MPIAAIVLCAFHSFLVAGRLPPVLVATIATARRIPLLVGGLAQVFVVGGLVEARQPKRSSTLVLCEQLGACDTLRELRLAECAQRARLVVPTTAVALLEQPRRELAEEADE